MCWVIRGLRHRTLEEVLFEIYTRPLRNQPRDRAVVIRAVPGDRGNVNGSVATGDTLQVQFTYSCSK